MKDLEDEIREEKQKAAKDLFSLLLRSLEKDEEMDNIIKKEHACMKNRNIYCFECSCKDDCTLKKSFGAARSESGIIETQIILTINKYSNLLAYLLDAGQSCIPWLHKRAYLDRKIGIEPCSQDKILARKLNVKL